MELKKIHQVSILITVAWIVTAIGMLASAASMGRVGQIAIVVVAMMCCIGPAHGWGGAVCLGYNHSDTGAEEGRDLCKRRLKEAVLLLATLLWWTGCGLWLGGQGGLWFRAMVSSDYVARGVSVSSIPKNAHYLQCDDGWFPPATDVTPATLAKDFKRVSKGIAEGSVAISVFSHLPEQG